MYKGGYMRIEVALWPLDPKIRMYWLFSFSFVIYDISISHLPGYSLTIIFSPFILVFIIAVVPYKTISNLMPTTHSAGNG